MASGVVVVAYLFLLVGFLACGVSFFAPYWVFTVNEDAYEGLWGRCRNLEQDYEEGVLRFRCVWFHEDGFGWEKSKPVWFLASQVLDAFGIVTIFSILVIASIHICCTCCKESVSLLKAMGALLIIGVMLYVLGFGLFAGMSWREEKTSVNSQISRFEWGFYIAIPGVIVTTLSAILYMIESCRYDGYEGGHNMII